MQNLVRQVNTLTNEILSEWDISIFEAMQIAVQIQQNSILFDAYVLGHSGPGALEKIAMELENLNDILIETKL